MWVFGFNLGLKAKFCGLGISIGLGLEVKSLALMHEDLSTRTVILLSLDHSVFFEQSFIKFEF